MYVSRGTRSNAWDALDGPLTAAALLSKGSYINAKDNEVKLLKHSNFSDSLGIRICIDTELTQGHPGLVPSTDAIHDNI